MSNIVSERGIQRIAAVKAKRCVEDIKRYVGPEYLPAILSKLIEYLTLEWECVHGRS